jgi:hypothetical protein
VRHCCCAGGVRWLAQKCCDSSCLGTCPDSEESCECAEGLTFCDAYRAAQGMPSPMDPTMCYWWFHNGCRYRVLGTDSAPCVAVPGTPHNAGNYGGATARLPNDPFCEDTCASVCGTTPLYKADAAPWIPGCGCGTTKTISFDMNGAKCCGCDCDVDAPLLATCSRVCPNTDIVLTLQHWPMGWVYDPAGCSEVTTDCVGCKSTGNPDSIPASINRNDLIGANYCDDNCPDVDPCDPYSTPCNNGGVGPRCSANGSITITLQGNTGGTYQFGFSITRSCPEGDCSAAPTWVTGGPVAGSPALPSLAICDCSVSPCACCAFYADGSPGTNAKKLAQKINQVLGAGSGGCVTYEAVGEEAAWLANSYACIADTDGTFPSTNTCHQCLYDPCSWIGPFFSNCNRTATWLYKNNFVYQVDASYGCANSSSFNVDNDRCQCTGSPIGTVGGTWISASAPAAEFKYGGQCPQFPPFAAVSADPCINIPTIS